MYVHCYDKNGIINHICVHILKRSGQIKPDLGPTGRGLFHDPWPRNLCQNYAESEWSGIKTNRNLATYTVPVDWYSVYPQEKTGTQREIKEFMRNSSLYASFLKGKGQGMFFLIKGTLVASVKYQAWELAVKSPNEGHFIRVNAVFVVEKTRLCSPSKV